MITACIVMDSLAGLAIKKDSTLAIMMEAQARGWDLRIAGQHDLLFKDGMTYARMQPVELVDISGAEQHWYELGRPALRPLSDLQVVLMRKDPPFNMDYIYATYLLERAEEAGVLVVNKPQSLRDCNEKLFATRFLEYTPPLLVSANREALSAFHALHGDIVMKPLDGMGGEGVFRLHPNDKNSNVIIETLTRKGRRQIMAQLFLPEVSQGDKRILLLDGEPIPYALARIPAANDNRANLAAGGQGVAQPLTARDLQIAQAVGPALKRLGLVLVGLDVIGDYITEINVTCPTGIRELDVQCDLNIAGTLLDCIERKLGSPTS